MSIVREFSELLEREGFEVVISQFNPELVVFKKVNYRTCYLKVSILDIKKEHFGFLLSDIKERFIHLINVK